MHKNSKKDDKTIDYTGHQNSAKKTISAKFNQSE